ncbi:MAG: homoserine dehydrogenase [Desulfobacterales bacterium]
MKEVNVGLLGFGTVGTGVAKILLESADMITNRLGAALRLKKIADIDTTTDRGIVLANGMLTPHAEDVISDPDIHIIVELIGGRTTAKDLILEAMDGGKHIVTANKALLAHDGNVLLEAARSKRVDLAFEASVGGCMPIIKTLKESLAGNAIEAMTGILNGTCNYILSRISDDGLTFDAALAEARKEGFAEADPTLDIEGHDTAHKLAILNALAFGTDFDLGAVYVEGISRITPLDIAFARQFGYRIKLLAIGKDTGEAIEARVHPTMIPVVNPLSDINGSLNAVTIAGDRTGDLVLSGYGAGMFPTASAVVGDIVDLARNLLCGCSERVPTMSFIPETLNRRPVLPIENLVTHYYFRFAAVDRPGVLSKISGILGDHNISLKSVHQKGRKSEGPVPIVMFTHLAVESEVRTALKVIWDLDVVTAPPILIRIEDENSED